MMPDAVAEFVVNLASEKDDVVWDPFLGGGTTALACERLGRRWIANDQSLEFVKSARINLEANGIPTRLISAA